MRHPSTINTAPTAYAGFWKRFAATMLDAMLLLCGAALCQLGGIDPVHWIRVGDASVPGLVLVFGAAVAICWSYWSGFESSPLQATPGKLAVGIYVTDLQGERLDFLSASARFYGKILSTLTLGIGYLMAGTTRKHQALHDLVSGCLVLSH